MNLTEEKKSEAIALLLQNKSITYVAKTLDLSKHTVSRIKDDLIAGKYESQLLKVQNNLGEIIADSLLIHLQALNQIALVATDENYLLNQDAKSIGELHKQIRDWTLEILTAGNNIQRQTSSYIEAELIEDRDERERDS
jgi:transposase-like protein